MRIRSVCLALVLFISIVGWSASAHSHQDLLGTWEGEIDLVPRAFLGFSFAISIQ